MSNKTEEIEVRVYSRSELLESLFEFADMTTEIFNKEIFKDENRNGMSVYVISDRARVDVVSLDRNGLKTLDGRIIPWGDVDEIDFDDMYILLDSVRREVMQAKVCEFFEAKVE